MAFVTDPEKLVDDLMTRKEFFSLAGVHESKAPEHSFFKLNEIGRYNLIDVTDYGEFIENFLNVNTPYTRLLMKWATGIGKTINSLRVATKFIQKLPDKHSSVIIVGFSYDVFRKELLTFPEFGFVTIEEIMERKRLLELSKKNPIYLRKAKSYVLKQLRRLTNREKNGFYQFMGYITFFNKILQFSSKYLKTQQFTKIETISNFSPEELEQMIKNKDIVLNETILASLKNSMLIFDEVHKVYNSNNINTWGFAIQELLTKLKYNPILFLTATPIMHLPSEIISMLNLLHAGKTPPLHKNDFFDKHENLLPGALDRIASLSKGYVSFVIDTTSNAYATVKYEGKFTDNQKTLPLIAIEMSREQCDIYFDILSDKKKLQRKYVSVFDIVFPEKILSVTDAANKIKYTADYGPKYKLQTDHEKNLSGDFFLLPNLRKYSPKYFFLLQKILEQIKKKRAKSFVFHELVQSSGINLLGVILQTNGFVELGYVPQNNSLCFHCQKPKLKHSGSHEFAPIIFAKITGKTDTVEKTSILDILNHVNNTNGINLAVILGSRITIEALSFKAVQNIFIVHRPENIPTIVQIIGRGIRKYAHASLKPKDRVVTVYVFVSVLPKKYKEKSYDEKMFLKKIRHFNSIREIEIKLHSNAVDNFIHGPRINETLTDTDIIKPMKYPYQVPSGVVNDTSFRALMQDKEINTCLIIIKLLFLEHVSFWKYKDLLNAVRDPPFFYKYATETISEHSFRLALFKLCYTSFNSLFHDSVQSQFKHTTYNQFEQWKFHSLHRLTNPNSKYLYLPYHNSFAVIVNVGEWYILAPIQNDKPMLMNDMFLRLEASIEPLSVSFESVIKSFQKTSTFQKNEYITFLNKIEKLNFESVYQAASEYNFEFHKDLLRHIMRNVYASFSNRKQNTSFFKAQLKMLFVYDSMNIIRWFSETLQQETRILFSFLKQNHFDEKKYTNYVVKQSRNVIPKETDNKFINMLSVTEIEHYKSQWNLMSHMLQSNFQKYPNALDFVPVGFCFNKLFFSFNGRDFWQISAIHKKPINQQKFKYVGYDYIQPSNMKLIFKIKTLVQHHDDKRYVHTGINCNSLSKKKLQQMCTDLGYSMKNQTRLNLCAHLRKLFKRNNNVLYLRHFEATD